MLAAMAIGVAQADELNSASVALADAAPNLVSNGGFGVNLDGWSFVDPSAAWDTVDASGNPISGSIELNEAEPFDELSVARQCVLLPAPGTYQLEAKGNGGTAARFSDFLEVRYAFQPSGSSCADFSSSYGVLVIPLGTGWKAAPSPALIDVPAAAWSLGATIAVDLVIVRNQGDEFSGLSGRFDDVSLVLRGDPVFKDSFD